MVIFHFDKNAQSLKCSFQGKLDTLATNELQEELTTAIDKNLGEGQGSLIFDFEKVNFITSAFIRLCVVSARKVGQESFSIVNTNPLIKKTLKIAGLDQQLNVS